MSKRAEEAALKAYPYFPTEVNLFGHKTITADGNSCDRAKYQKGYEQAEKDLGWISVKDRLPEKDGWYFTCVEQFKIPQCVGITYFDKKTDGWYNDIPMGKKSFMTTIEIVDYWMEIPALPEEEEK